ncbi:MAG TPA: Na+-transporting NADH:ubiquinone oxidoreductase subunit D [Lachnospiraceae bacterium]|nr:RnfABCDGE type electron transport complex subunit D [uncultured Lachnoclostridium sp.]HAU85164.1 Na+-transporting NADH:ubiquinone oxidoreductase subunit D [Lachnospiraceae bacterium]
MSELLNVSASPHVRSKDSTKTIMRDVAIALVPAAGFGVYNFGVKALLILLASIASCMLTEYIYEMLMHKKITTSDYSALVTGLLLGMNLPSSVPVWMPILGGVFAILIVKQLFGGLGQNFMNPALAARCFLMISFAKHMTTFTYDGVTGATPLYLIKSGDKASAVSDILSQGGTSIFDMFTGNIAGTIGETSVIAILIGAAYLFVKKVITWKIPVTYIVTFAVFVLIFGGRGFDVSYLAAELCGGGLMLGAFFMATDYVTSPITPKGQIVFGIFLGLLTGIFRIFGGTAEGVSYAIIFCNLLVPLIERFTLPVPFGKESAKNE